MCVCDGEGGEWRRREESEEAAGCKLQDKTPTKGIDPFQNHFMLPPLGSLWVSSGK